MEPIMLEGQTLGHKHKHYNTLVKTALTAKPTTKVSSINYKDSDVNNLFKIDVACSNKDIPYILEVLQCEDMLYVSRAIKKSAWLLSENKYANIINPEYLKENLFPYMMVKAKNKLLLSIRLNLKDETRVQDFFHFFKDDFKTAQKWLPYCSLSFIEEIISSNAINMSANILRRLCEKSVTVLKIYCENCISYNKRDILKDTLFLLNTNINEYLDIIESTCDYMKPNFGKKATQLMMTKCPERIIKKFELYCPNIHEATMAKHMKKVDIREFLIEQKQNNKLQSWFRYDNICHYIKYMPKQEKFEFVKKLFIDKMYTLDTAKPEVSWIPSSLTQTSLQCCASNSWFSTSNAHIYLWYRFAPFEVAFHDLKKLIRMESSPAERIAILTVLIKCTRHNPQHVQTLLQYYREKHINEPIKFKVQFINAFITFNKTHKFDKVTWNILNDIFSSMEIYLETESCLPFCISTILVYKVLHDENVPEIIEQKFKFNPLKEWHKKLDDYKKEKLFNYLYKLALSKLPNGITHETDLTTAVGFIHKILILFKEWKKNITDHPIILDKIKEIIIMKKKNSWEINLSSLFNVRKQWRRHMFEQSLILYPTDDACVNALKHDPELLSRYRGDVETMFSNDAIRLRRTLRKIRVYWTQTLCQTWTDAYLKRLEQPRGHKSLIEGIGILMPRELFILLLQKHAPVETKIDWSDTNVNIFNLRKNIAKNMKFVRPSLNVDAVLLYAKEDYLQYTLPSLNAILHNLSPMQSSSCLLKLLSSPVSLQKHGIRLAFSKLKIEKIKGFISELWKNTKNSSIRAVLFIQTFELLCKESMPSTITQIWTLLLMFIEHLSTEENKAIYNALGKVQNVPLLVRGQFFMKSYIYLQSQPPKSNCGSILQTLDSNASDIVHLLEPSFIEDIFLKTLADRIVEEGHYLEVLAHLNILSLYLLHSVSEEIQQAKFEKVLRPLMRRCLASWKKLKKGECTVRKCIKSFLEHLCKGFKTLIKKKSFVMPVKLFKAIQQTISEALTDEDDYDILITLNTIVLFIETINSYIVNNPIINDDEETEMVEPERFCTPAKSDEKNDEIWKKICTDIAPLYGEACLNYLKKDILMKYPTLYAFVAKSLLHVFTIFNVSDLNRCQSLKAMLIDVEATTIYLVVIDSIRYMSYSVREATPVIKEINKILKCHTVREVKIHYYEYYNSQYHTESESNNEA